MQFHLNFQPQRKTMNGKVSFKVVSAVLSGALLLAAGVVAQTSGIVKVSDVVEGPYGGGVSVARCGTTVVAGFGDQESAQPKSLDGFAVSKNGGAGFKDLGTLPPNPDRNEYLGFGFVGNPAVACSNYTTFYYASAAVEVLYNWTAISVSKSTNGGISWNTPVLASGTQFDTKAFGLPSIAGAPSNKQRLYLA